MKHLFGALLGGVTAAAFAHRMLSGTTSRLVIDVGSSEEFSTEHIPGARSLPLEQLEQQVASTIPDPATPLTLYCRTGEKARLAAERLRSLGYTHIESVSGMREAMQKLHQLL
ncbi:phage shock protein E precursor [Aquitalea magnusonii]|jgi:rhodanese-related sulfurtransferase|uniref:Phage shock protein E n=1 Tax=Aquitalea magnusonii TaxID=332411 RepID=A0A3G9GSE2_9NEIS|nr:rhodanese-like domain-containing protein [Aquitalea magnusonii]BBF87417.1 phage shock protein E precursor [Aquitalea magnusonii]